MNLLTMMPWKRRSTTSELEAKSTSDSSKTLSLKEQIVSRRKSRLFDARIFYSDYGPDETRHIAKISRNIIENAMKTRYMSEEEFYKRLASEIQLEVGKYVRNVISTWSCVAGNNFSICTEAKADSIIFLAIGDVKILLFRTPFERK
ncbi:unnamed protein product [Caenorhabditis bovis]|uniref:Dynein light chain n=1 Tax=Caenorhabditis bovis TaxID=2654633 RepID=A0A8S1EDB4_9PELO|nr:unnamed protein product [Caenorhabditis bovis]